MKNLTFTVLAALLAFFIIQGCNKETLSAVGGKLKASKAEIKVGQLDTLLLTSAGSTDSVQWTVAPAGFDFIGTKANAARVFFSKAGTYVVTAQKTNGGTPASVTIKVIPDDTPVDTVKTPTDTTSYVSLAGDVITLHPSLGRSTLVSDSVIVNFYAVTTKTYCSRGVLQYNAQIDAFNNFTVDFINVREPKVCSNTPDIPMGISNIFRYKNLGVGTYPLKATLNGTTYNGTIVVSATEVTFNWNYTTGIVITPKVMKKDW
ncbi:MAG: hypothetical protein JWR50_622 [Mucilaginibacter sp.]|nr:hypothetical protein [Mucilaginibacter sp.]